MNVPIFFILLISQYYLWGYLRVRVHFSDLTALGDKGIIPIALIN